jgi:hypothetical protein
MTDPFTLTLIHEGMYVTENGWMLRHPRGSKEGYLLDLTNKSTEDDWQLLHVQHKESLSVLFETPEHAIAMLSPLIKEQVRVGSRWVEDQTGCEVEVTHIDYKHGQRADTIYVQLVEEPKTSWSPGDFLKNFTRASC